ncbi:MAG TPA: hypothetical protein VGM27_16460 [Acidobacteriaceae bacterium]|jgi:hypothetical protein
MSIFGQQYSGYYPEHEFRLHSLLVTLPDAFVVQGERLICCPSTGGSQSTSTLDAWQAGG